LRKEAMNLTNKMRLLYLRGLAQVYLGHLLRIL
jgi:hypothetical protein